MDLRLFERAITPVVVFNNHRWRVEGATTSLSVDGRMRLKLDCIADYESCFDVARNRGQYGPVDIRKVIFNDPATIVFWTDGTKTVVKCGDDELFDPEKGLAMAISKKALGNKGNYFETFKKWTDPYYEEEANTIVDALTDFGRKIFGSKE